LVKRGEKKSLRRGGGNPGLPEKGEGAGGSLGKEPGQTAQNETFPSRRRAKHFCRQKEKEERKSRKGGERGKKSKPFPLQGAFEQGAPIEGGKKKGMGGEGKREKKEKGGDEWEENRDGGGIPVPV